MNKLELTEAHKKTSDKLVEAHDELAKLTLEGRELNQSIEMYRRLEIHLSDLVTVTRQVVEKLLSSITCTVFSKEEILIAAYRQTDTKRVLSFAHTNLMQKAGIFGVSDD